MSTTEQENGDGDMVENNIQHNYFEHTLVKDWKIIGALAYYINQNVGTSAAYNLIEVSLKKAMNTRKCAKKRGECLLEELSVLKAIHEGETPLPSSAESPNPIPSTTKISDKINNFGEINQTNNILQSRKRKEYTVNPDIWNNGLWNIFLLWNIFECNI